MLDVDATFSPAPTAPEPAQGPLAALLTDATDVSLSDAATPPLRTGPPRVTDAADNRPVTPRRPLRLTSARPAGDSPAIALPVPNIFEGVFDTEDSLVDPRLQRSRARARSLLATREAALTPAERNLWHDDEPAPAPAPEAPTAASEPTRSGRRVRHLTIADLAKRNHAQVPVTSDPLRDRLTAIREALYAPDPEAEALAKNARPLAQRLTAQVLNVVLLTVALPVGAVVATITVLRGADLTLSSRAVALVGALTGILQLAPLPGL